MATHTFPFAHTLLLALATLLVAAPSARAQTNAETPRNPTMLKRIFVDADEKLEISKSNKKDVLKLRIAKSGSAQNTKSSSPVMAVATSAAALIFVVGIFLLVAWLMKRGASTSMRALPTEAFEVLGRSTLGPQQAVQLVRLGNKLLLVASSAEGASTLAEIDDKAEVERLAAMCMTGKETSATQEFHEALEDLSTNPTESTPSLPKQPASMLDLSMPTNDSLSLSEASLLKSAS
ncbi:MAG: flagellar biosynthetic protein FliO [Pirellulales bacterium]|nr:flagellar biosynthetic protein FliO [Pirellulales bacterium]